MMDYMLVVTPMEANLKKLHDSAISSDLVDLTMYQQLIGSQLYLVNTKSYIFYAVNALSQHMVELRQVHWVISKHVLRYLRGIIGYGMRYTSNNEVKLEGFRDSNWARSVVDKKSTYGCCFSLGSTMVFWFSKKHTSVELSTTEEEYIAACAASKEAVWLPKLAVEWS